MKRKYLRTLAMLLIFPILFMLLVPTVSASSLPGLRLPVTVKLSGGPPTEDEDYTIVLKADNPEYPMPEGSLDGSYTMTIKGEGSKELPEINFSSVGVYTYTISQLAGVNELASYDDKVYNLVVFVTNAKNGSGLEITVNLYLLGEKEKQDELLFLNNYEKEPSQEVEIPEPEDKPKEEAEDGFEQTATSAIGLSLFALVGMVGVGTVVTKKKKEN
ncbi:Spy0128 family protein [Jeotgalibaca porci]|uniref:Spy0128 family protein n=1 Tax=Jeotgalibaca porci TaxID=1868793 RepID=UPI00359F2EF5